MKTTPTAEKVKRLAQEDGVELAGIDLADTFPELVAARPPQGLLAGSKSVVVCGISIHLWELYPATPE